MKIGSIILLALYLVFGVAAGTYTGLLANNEKALISSAKSATAIMTDVEEGAETNPFTNSKTTTYTPYYEFTVGDTTYTSAGATVKSEKNPFSEKNINNRKAQEVIFYNPANHAIVDTQSPKVDYYYLATLGFGFIVFVLAVVGLSKSMSPSIRWRY